MKRYLFVLESGEIFTTDSVSDEDLAEDFVDTKIVDLSLGSYWDFERQKWASIGSV